MTKETKQCCVRIPKELHNWAKGYAYHAGLTLQEFICSLIEEKKGLIARNQKDGK